MRMLRLREWRRFTSNYDSFLCIEGFIDWFSRKIDRRIIPGMKH
jgi:hypothetical protein